MIHSLSCVNDALSLAFTTPFTRIIIIPSMQKSLPISPCPSHFMSFQSEIESKTAHNRDATQFTPPVSISIPSPPILSFPQSVTPSFSHYIHSTRNSPPLPLLPIFHYLSLTNDPIPHSSHPHSKTHKTPPFPSPSNSITPLQSSLSPFQHPFNNNHPSASNRKTSHLAISTSPPKTQHTQSPITPYTPPLHSKESTTMHLYNLTIHKPSVVQRSIYGWRRLC